MNSDILDRYVAGDPIAKLVADAGVSADKIYAAVRFAGLSGKRFERRKTKAREIAERLAAHILWTDGIDVFQRSRKRNVVNARMAVMFVLRERGYSLPVIAQAVHLKDHTTVLHGLRVAQEQPEIMGMVAMLRAVH